MNKISYKGWGKGKILIISGVHGDETTPVYLTHLIMEAKSKSIFKDYEDYEVLTVVNAVNPDALKAKTRSFTDKTDQKDVNRVLGSLTNDSIPEIKKELFDLIKEHDLIIDVHSSPDVVNEFVLIDANTVGSFYVDFCNKFGIPWVARTIKINTIKSFAINQGKLAFTLELNGINFTDKASALKGLRIIDNIIKGAVKITNRYKTTFFPGKPFVYQDYIDIKSKYEGILEILGDAYRKKGEIIAVVHQFSGYDYIVAPCDCLVFQSLNLKYVGVGESAIWVQPTTKIKKLYKTSKIKEKSARKSKDDGWKPSGDMEIKFIDSSKA